MIVNTKLKSGKFMVPVQLIFEGGDYIFVKFSYNKGLIAEIKSMDGAKWMGYDEKNPRKIWRINNSYHNLFQLKYLQGLNPYAPYDKELVHYEYERPLYTHQKLATDFLLARKRAILAAEMGCVDGNAAVHVNRAKRGFSISIKELFYKFHGGMSGRGKSWDLSVPTYIRSLKGEILGLNRIVNVLHKGVKDVVKLTLKSGKSIILTDDHEVCVGFNQFKPVGSLLPDDTVLTNGTWIDKDGYVRVGGLKGRHHRWTTGGVYEHILVAESILGREIKENEHVHHINRIKHDNRPENLEVLTPKQHISGHNLFLNMDGGVAGNGGSIQFVPKIDEVLSIEKLDKKYSVFDIVCDDPYRNFVADGIIVHNCGKSVCAIEVMERSGSDDWWYVGPRSAIKAVELELRKWNSKVQPEMITYDKLTKIVKTDSYDTPFGIWFDESSRIKSPTAQRSQAAAIIADDVREKDGYLILTSGTPAPKSPVDWFWQAKVACPGFLKEGSYHKFRSALALIEQQEGPYGQAYPKIVTWLDNDEKCAICGELKSNHGFIQGTDHPFKPSINECGRLYKRMKGLVLVQFKKDCLDLPEKIYRRIELQPSKRTLEIARALVKSAPTVIKGLILLRELSDGFQYIEKPTGEKSCAVCFGSGEIVSPINNEEKIICDGCGGTGKTTIYSRTTEQIETPKDEALRDLLDEYSEIGRVVIYAGFTGSVDRCVQICQDLKWNYIRVDGRGWHSDINDENSKDHLINFQERIEKYPRVAFIGQPGAAGMGLTLTASPVIIYYSNDFNAESRTQSEDRIHRPGTRGCTIIDLLHLETDYLVLENLQKKRDLQAITMGDMSSCLSKCSHE